MTTPDPSPVPAPRAAPDPDAPRARGRERRGGRACAAIRRAARALALGVGAVALSAAAGFVLVSGPIDRSPILGTDVHARTEAHLDLAARRAASAPAETGPLRAGFGEGEMTPPVGTPTLGYGARLGRGTERVADPIFARALALAAGAGPPVVLVSGEVCLWPRALSERVAARVAARLPRERLYFGATHTHNGPGAITKGPVLEWMFGAYDDAVVARVVDGAARAIEDALADLAAAEWREHAFAAPDLVENRMHGDDPVDDEVYVLEVRQRGSGRRYALAVFAAHATAISHALCVTSGDWPGAAVRGLEARGFAGALVMAGPTGQAGPRVDGRGVYEPSTEGAYRLGSVLAERIAAVAALGGDAPRPGAGSGFAAEIALAHLYAEVELPPWRLSRLGRTVDPYWSGRLIAEPTPRAHVHALGVGDPAARAPGTVLVGHSFEMSSVLARRWKAAARARGGARVVVTSFNGEHGFYVVPEEDHEDGLYESGMTFFGPGLGAYLERVTARAVEAIERARAGSAGGGPAPLAPGATLPDDARGPG